MGVKNVVKKIGDKAGNKVAKLATLSSLQVEEIQNNREKYLLQKPDPRDKMAQDITNRMMAASSIEIFNSYLPQISKLYLPVEKNAEYDGKFDVAHNIRYFNITKWVTDKKENSLEKLVNVYAVLSNENCNIALVFNRTQETTNVYLAVVNLENSSANTKADNYKSRLIEAIRGNFPGAELKEKDTNNKGFGVGILPCINNDNVYTVASASNIPTEKSEKFISQTIEKLLDGIVPNNRREEYTIILLATPIMDVEERKLKLGEFHSGMTPYASWSTNYTYTENESLGSTATIGVNVGASAGIQNGKNYGTTDTEANTENESITNTESESDSLSNGDAYAQTESEADTTGTNKNTTHTEGKGQGVSVIVYNNSGNSSDAESWGENAAKTLTKGITQTTSKTVAKTTGTAVANTLGKAVTKSMAVTSGISNAVNYGVNAGANFARSSTITTMIGKNEGITQNFANYNVKHALELLENQMKRLEQSTALGMWDFAAYVLSEDQIIASNVAHSYLALTIGEESFMSKSAINLWRGNVDDEKEAAREICGYLKELRHPLFALNPEATRVDAAYNIYPSVITATTSLSGKELAYSLNFPQKSISGLPVLECAEFGRSVVTYDEINKDDAKLELGNIFHMNHMENVTVSLSKKSLASHTFITGSTGSGKSNTVYQIIDKASQENVKFLIIEPAKGEYKNVFGNREDVFVYGTNPNLSKLLRINPFSFPKEIHILEHMDRLIEIFNVCWPMYAAMPAILKNAVEQSYIDSGWDLIKSVNRYDSALYPTFKDVARNIKIIIDSSEYDNDNKGAYKGSLLTRLQSLTNGINGIIFNSQELSEKELFDENVIVDLSRVGSSETKSLLMGMIVLKLQEYRMSCSNNMNAELKHLTVLEEAHNILRRTSVEQSAESSNLMGKSVEMLSNAIAEMRTYGEGFIIADQAPGLMDMSVIRNTNTKIIMRLPDEGDRQLVGKSANLNEDQIVELAKLPCGVGAIYQNEWVQPVLCKVKKFDGSNGIFTYYNTENLLDEEKEVTESLLDCIMNKEIFGRGNKKDISKLKDKVVKSKLDAKVKVDLIGYIDSGRSDEFETLRTLIYDFLSARNAIDMARNQNDFNQCIQEIVNQLSPSIRGYSKKQIDITLSLILNEQAERNPEFGSLYCKFIEVLEDKGGVL